MTSIDARRMYSEKININNNVDRNTASKNKKEKKKKQQREKKEKKSERKKVTHQRRSEAEQTETMVDADKQDENDNTSGLIKRSPIVETIEQRAQFLSETGRHFFLVASDFRARQFDRAERWRSVGSDHSSSSARLAARIFGQWRDRCRSRARTRTAGQREIDFFSHRKFVCC